MPDETSSAVPGFKPKRFAAAALGSLVNRDRFNDTALYWLYLFAFRREYVRAKRHEIAFYRDFLRGASRPLVFDIGANAGHKTWVFAKMSALVVAVEPSPGAIEVLVQRFSSHDRVRIIQQAVGAHQGVAELLMFGHANPYNTLSRKWSNTVIQQGLAGMESSQCAVQVTTLDELIERQGLPDYIKVDVEGFESEVFQGLSRAVPRVSFEVNLPTFRREATDIIQHLSKLGDYQFNFVTTEPPKEFALKSWVSPSAMCAAIIAFGDPYMEIYATG